MNFSTSTLHDGRVVSYVLGNDSKRVKTQFLFSKNGEDLISACNYDDMSWIQWQETYYPALPGSNEQQLKTRDIYKKGLLVEVQEFDQQGNQIKPAVAALQL